MTLALVTAREARDKDEDMPILSAALASRGMDHRIVDWDDPDIDFAQFHCVLIRSTWDYTDRLPEFLRWADRVAACTALQNPLPVVAWNTHKGYLLELASNGVPIVPTTMVRVGQPMPLPGAGELVVKPAVSAGSRGARRFVGDPVGAMRHGEALLAQGRDVLVQPYLDRVDSLGETSLLYFNGVFSHAIRKGPLLTPNGEPTRALFAAEHITPRTPSAEELATGAKVLAALPFAMPLYARVDLLQNPQGEPQLLELELTEPSLFFHTAERAVASFVDALLART